MPETTENANPLRFHTERFYESLDVIRMHKRYTWNQCADEAGVSSSVFSRMAKGGNPDADGLVRLLAWSNLDLASFTTTTTPPATKATDAG
jgi:transcriptional regulator with XRE-family HTH domain